MDDTLLSMFLKTPAIDHLPRATTGKIPIHKEGPVMTVQRDETLPRVFRKLATEGFLSAPVLDGREYVGFIDMLDLVKFTTNLFRSISDTPVGHSTPSADDADTEAWISFWDKEDTFETATVADVMRVPSTGKERDPSPPVQRDFTTFYVLEAMARKGLHRVAIVDPETKRVEGIITQSMLISWIRQNMDKLGELRSRKVEDVFEQWEHRNIIAVPQSMKTIDAFDQMVAKNVGGLAVVDEDGVITGAISLRDLRGIGISAEQFSRLFLTVQNFKKAARTEFPLLAPATHFSKKMVPGRSLYVSPDDTFADVIQLMFDGNIHRVFVCSRQSIEAKAPKPTHVISQKDVLKVVLQFMCEA